jgi:hypothetical protein
MKTVNPSVLVRLELSLDEEKKQHVTNHLHEQSGIIDVIPSNIRPNLFIVEYDAVQMSLLQILNIVRGEDKSAFLVGM